VVEARSPVRFGKYLKAAFANRWNLLFLAGAAGFAFLSGRADVCLPLVLAGEAAYLGLLAAHPKFQAYVDAHSGQREQQDGSIRSEREARQIYEALPPESRKRFNDLWARCLELRRLAADLKDPARIGLHPPLEEMQLAGLDRLLWIYLRLLYAGYSLERFQKTTSDTQIEADIANLEKRLQKAAQVADEPRRQKVTRAIEDNLQTCRDRLANFRRARDNHELVLLEIERLENKIRALSELAVNRQEPDFISSQVDQVASGMLLTERTINELQFATGLETPDEAVPQLLRGPALQMGRQTPTR